MVEKIAGRVKLASRIPDLEDAPCRKRVVKPANGPYPLLVLAVVVGSGSVGLVIPEIRCYVFSFG